MPYADRDEHLAYHRGYYRRPDVHEKSKAAARAAHHAMTPAQKAVRDEERRQRQRTPKSIASKRDSRYKKKYGITLVEYDALLASQGGHCRFCHLETETNGARLTVDHDHATKVVRGILCRKHNAALGAFGDTADGVMRAVLYLQGDLR